MKKLAKYEWQQVGSHDTGTVTLYDTEEVLGEGKRVPVFVAEAVRFMFRTKTKVLRTDEYEVHLDYIKRKQ